MVQGVLLYKDREVIPRRFKKRDIGEASCWASGGCFYEGQGLTVCFGQKAIQDVSSRCRTCDISGR